MPSANEFIVRVGPIAGELQIRLQVDAGGLWTAQVIGYDGCVADGRTKQDAIEQAVILWLHCKIGQIRRGNWHAPLKKPREDD